MDVEKMIAEIKAELLKNVAGLADGAVKANSDALANIEAILKEFTAKVELIEKNLSGSKLNIFTTEQEADAKAFLEWFQKAMISVPGVKVDDAMNETTDADGGYLVPEDYKAQLVRLIEEYGKVRQKAFVLPITRDRMTLPALASGVVVYWVDENEEITKSKAQLDRVLLEVKKMAALIPVTNELLTDSSIPMANLIATLIAEGFAQEEDRVALVGDSSGTDPFDGILYVAGTNAVIMGSGAVDFTDATYDDLYDMQAAISEAALAGAEYIMHRTIFNIFKKMKDGSDQYIWNPSQPGEQASLCGLPYMLHDKMPAVTATAVSTPFVILGNLRHVYIGDRMELTIKTSEHLWFGSDVLAVRGTQREAIAVAIPAAFAILVTAAS